MTSVFLARAAPIALIGALLASGLVSTRVSASPDGADWEAADEPQGCGSCHLGDPPIESSDALSIEGLPQQPESGKSYELTIRLRDPALKNAGFLLSIRSDATPTGTLESLDGRTETDRNRARSTWDGSFPPAAGEASWTVVWTAPPSLESILHFDLWANAGNDDLSPLGDRVHHRVWSLPNGP